MTKSAQIQTACERFNEARQSLTEASYELQRSGYAIGHPNVTEAMNDLLAACHARQAQFQTAKSELMAVLAGSTEIKADLHMDRLYEVRGVGRVLISNDERAKFTSASEHKKQVTSEQLRRRVERAHEGGF